MQAASLSSESGHSPRLAQAWARHLDRRAAYARFVTRAVLVGTVLSAGATIASVSAGHPYVALASTFAIASAVATFVVGKRPESDAVELFEAMAGLHAAPPREAGRPTALVIRGPWRQAAQPSSD